jgi:aryl-alcohol dehydrogenase-like predicted oxidoreductase
MQKRPLGRSGLHTEPLIFGGNVFDWTIDEKQSFAMLDAWLGAGFSAVDTANMYSAWVTGHRGGESETVLGRYFAARGNRDRVLLTTKVGMKMGDGSSGLSKAYILNQADESLRRLQTDYIDLYLSHTDDETTPLEETLEAFQILLDQGKVRAIGASNYTASRLSKALSTADSSDLPRYTTLQPLYNLCERDAFENELAGLCLREQLGVTPYFALAAGFLTGKYRSAEDLKGKTRQGMVGKYMNDHGMRILQALDAVATRVHSNPAAVALAWLVGQPGVTAAIVSATTTEQMEQLIQAARLKLDADALRQLSEASV